MLFGEVRSFDLNRNVAHADTGEISFDYLVVCCGARDSYLGHDEWKEYAPGWRRSRRYYGVELAGAISEMNRHTLVKDFKAINTKSSQIILLEAGPGICPPWK